MTRSLFRPPQRGAWERRDPRGPDPFDFRALPRGARVPRHDFNKRDNMPHPDPSASKGAVVYRGYVPLELLSEVLAEEEDARQRARENYLCQACEYEGPRGEFRVRHECPECGSEDYEPPPEVDTGYDWEEFNLRGTFPPAEVVIEPDGTIRLADGNHRTRFWREAGFLYAPAWVIDQRRAP